MSLFEKASNILDKKETEEAMNPSAWEDEAEEEEEAVDDALGTKMGDSLSSRSSASSMRCDWVKYAVVISRLISGANVRMVMDFGRSSILCLCEKCAPGPSSARVRSRLGKSLKQLLVRFLAPEMHR